MASQLYKSQNNDKLRDDCKDFWPTEAEMVHYEKCSDGVVTIDTAKRLIRLIRHLQSPKT